MLGFVPNKVCRENLPLLINLPPPPILTQFLSRIVPLLTPMPRVMKHQRVTGLQIANEPYQAVHDVVPRGSQSGIGVIVRHEQHLIISEAHTMSQKVVHASCVINAPVKLRRGARVINATDKRAFPAASGAGHRPGNRRRARGYVVGVSLGWRLWVIKCRG